MTGASLSTPVVPLASQVDELTGQVTPLQLAVLVLVLLVLVFALVKKLVKTAIILAIAAGMVGLAIYGNAEGWFG